MSPKSVPKKSLKRLFLDTFKSLLEGPQGHFSRRFRAHPDFWRHSLGLGHGERRVYRGTGVSRGVQPTTWERSLKIWELQIPCFEEFFWGGNTLGRIPASLPHTLGSACTFYGECSTSDQASSSPTQDEMFIFGGIHSAMPHQCLQDGWILDTSCMEWKKIHFKAPLHPSTVFSHSPKSRAPKPGVTVPHPSKTLHTLGVSNWQVVFPKVPEGHKHRVTTPRTLGKSCGPPQTPAETPQNPRRDPAEPSERPPQSPRRDPRRAL